MKQIIIDFAFVATFLLVAFVAMYIFAKVVVLQQSVQGTVKNILLYFSMSWSILMFVVSIIGIYDEIRIKYL